MGAAGYRRAQASYHAIVARWDGSYEMDFAPGDLANFVVRRDGDGFGLTAAATSFSRGQWHHVVGVFRRSPDHLRRWRQRRGTNLGGVLQNAGPAPDRIMIGATRTGTEGSFNFKGCHR